ncbi:MAG: hypothetical protein WCL28_13280 [bacterium]|jgi:hypothetical protein
MSDRTTKVLKFLGMGVLWVYILSIRIGQETIYYHAHDILVENHIVDAIDRQLADAYDGAAKFASNTFSRLSGRDNSL